jgi:hypothetical protein
MPGALPELEAVRARHHPYLRHFRALQSTRNRRHLPWTLPQLYNRAQRNHAGRELTHLLGLARVVLI